MKPASLNHAYRLVWSDVLGAFVAVAEFARARGKSRSGRALLAPALLAPALALAGPSGGVLTHGSASISQAGKLTEIIQSSQKAVINWQGFSVGQDETVNFRQPDVSAVTLNRVVGNERSVIDGTVNANGQVFLINANGVLFGQGAQVDVGGLVAGTLDIGDEDFMAGRYTFSGSGGTVLNQGVLTAAQGGYIALLGKEAINEGVITATLGTVSLNGAEKVTLNFAGNSLVGVTLEQGALDALVANRQAILADGGRVFLTARAADELLSAQVNNTGVVQARTLGELKGEIVAYAHGGVANIDGTLDASAPDGGDGGFIETSGKEVNIADGSVVTTRAADGKSGTWLIDPETFTIGEGGNASGATVEAALANNGEFIATASNGDVNVNDAISWSSGTLTLTASENVLINNVLSATGTASFSANYGRVVDASGDPTSALTNGTGKDADEVPYGLYMAQSGFASFAGRVDFSGSGTVTLNGVIHTVIGDAGDMAAVTEGGNYVLGADLGDTYTHQRIAAFNGNLNGFGHTLLYANNASTSGQAGGLFGVLGSEAVLTNLGVLNGSSISNGSSAAVGRVANINHGSIVNVISEGDISNTVAAVDGASSIGGMVGINHGLIARSYHLGGNVGAVVIAGGLVGTNETTGRIVDSSVRGGYVGNVGNANSKNATWLGGFAGVNKGTIARSYTNSFLYSGTASTYKDSWYTSGLKWGGFVGRNAGEISEAYAYKTATSPDTARYLTVAGFVYENTGAITNAYSYNTLNGNRGNSAGFAYINSGTISNAYVRWGAMTQSADRCGFVCDNTGGELNNAYWSVESNTGTITGTAGTTSASALTSPDTLASYGGFDPGIWNSAQSGFPMLSNLASVFVGNDVVTLRYGNDPFTSTGDLYNTTSPLRAVGLQAGDTAASVLSIRPEFLSFGYLDAGTYAAADVVASGAGIYGLYGAFVVSPALLYFGQFGMGMGVIADKTYDGTTAATLKDGVPFGGFTTDRTGAFTLIGDQTLTVSYTASFDSKDAGASRSVTIADISITDGENGGKASNYVLADTSALTATAAIATRALTEADLIASIGGKVYDGDATATVNLGSSDTAALQDIANGTLGFSYTSAAFADANAGSGKAVTIYGLSLTGSDAANYTLGTTTLTGSADIAQRPVNVFGSSTDASLTTVDASTLSLGNTVHGDTVNLLGTALLLSSNPGSNGLDTGGLSLDNSNYTLVGGVASFTIGDFSRTVSSASRGVSFDDDDTPTVITTTQDKSIINWQNFAINEGETVRFDQPNTYSIVLNRVLGNTETIIAGALASNGRVFIINPNGVLFSAGASVDVAALLASTHTISDDDFQNGNYVFSASGGSGSVINEGDIIIMDGGFLALASGNGVESGGTLTARNGGDIDALLASANGMTLVLDESSNGQSGHSFSGLAGITRLSGTVNLGDGLLETAGGGINDTATITAGTRSITLPGITVGNGGTYGADYVENQLASRNLTLNSLEGDLIVADDIAWDSDSKLALSARDTITIEGRIAAHGANAGVALNSTDYYIDSARLDYDQNPTGHENAGITLSGGNATLNINGDDYVLLQDMADVLAIQDNSAGHYALAQEIDAAGTIYAAAPITTFSGTLAGLGNVIRGLTIDAGNDDHVGLIGQAGPGTVIRDLGVEEADIRGGSYMGVLLGAGLGATLNENNVVVDVNEIVLDNVWVSGTVTGPQTTVGHEMVGGMAGSLLHAQVSRARADVDVVVLNPPDYDIRGTQPSNNIGGLFGWVSVSDISHSYATGDVTGQNQTGGLIGRMQSDSTLTYSWASGNVSGGPLTSPDLEGNYGTIARSVGGLVGDVSGSVLDYVKAFGDVTAGQWAGGLIGSSFSSSIDHAVASGNVYAYWVDTGYFTNCRVGGLIGYNVDGSVSNSSASGDVITNGTDKYGGMFGGTQVGGLIGENDGGVVTSSSATGNVEGIQGDVAALIGDNSGEVRDSWASGTVSRYYSYANNEYLVGSNSGGTIVNSSGSGTVIDTSPAPPTDSTPDPVRELQYQAAQSIGGVIQQEAGSRSIIPQPGPFTAAGGNAAPPPVGASITVLDRHFSADIESIEVDGRAFDLKGGETSDRNEEEEGEERRRRAR
ncbi:two-partner secretion domain-containing protein [Pseudothauera rhizosphaerae]|nr:filamentous hemagglutinin N-terminal domain-containing protein [Pseudothauera rhizosphaerae]